MENAISTTLFVTEDEDSYQTLLGNEPEDELVRFARWESNKVKAESLIRTRSFMGSDGTLHTIDRVVVDPNFHDQDELQKLIESSGYEPSGTNDFTWKRQSH